MPCRFPHLTLVLAGLLAWPFDASEAVPACPDGVDVVQSGGQTVRIHLRGDEFLHWTEDTAGYTILFDAAAKNWVYATLNGAGQLAASASVVGLDNPSGLALPKRLLPNSSILKARAAAADRLTSAMSGEADGPVRAPKIGTMKNLVVLVGFSDKPFTRAAAEYEALFNTIGYTVDGASGSVKDYYREVSYNQLDVDSVVAEPVTLTNGYSYYGGNDAYGDDVRPREMVQEALAAMEARGFDFSTLDNDNDGAVDGLTVIHAGGGEEYGGNDTGYIWSHQWQMISTVTYDGKTMRTYHTEPERRGWDSNSSTWGITRIGVICHENGHFLGLPDLYDYGYDSKGVGDFCLMAGGSWNGNSGTQPAHMSAWCKKYLTWVTPTVVAASGTYSVPRVEDAQTVYRLNGTFPSTQYFLIENRQGYGFDASLPGSARGLLIWHVDETQANNNDQTHFKVDLEEASGAQHLETNSNEGDDSDYFRSGTMTQFTSTTTPNNKSYAGSALGLDITDVSAAANTMTFTVPAGPALSVSPAAVYASAVLGRNASTQQMQVWNSGLGSMAYTVADNVAWVTCTPAAGSSTGEHNYVDLGFITTNFGMGSYTGLVTVAAPGAEPPTSSVPVYLSVTSGPPLVDNLGPTNGGATAMSLRGYLYSTGGLPTTVRIFWGASDGGTAASSWVANTNLGYRGMGSFSATVSNLTPGTIYYQRCMASNSAGVVWAPASTNFGLGNWALSVSPLQFTNTVAYSASPTSGTFRVWNAGNGSMSYSISDNAAWISESPTSGTSTGEQDTVTITYASSGLAAGSYTGLITVTAVGATGSPQTVSSYLTVTNGPVTLPSITNMPASGVMSVQAAMRGHLVSVGGTIAYAGIHWGTSDGGTNIGSWSGHTNLGACAVGILSNVVSGLSPGTVYRYRYTASNAAGQVWAPSSTTFTSLNQVLSVSPAAFSNWIPTGAVCPSNTFQVRNAGSGGMSYTIADNAAWMSQSPASGSSTGEIDTIAITYSTTGLVAGVYTGLITVTSTTGATGSPQYVYSYLWVGNAPPAVSNQAPAWIETNAATLRGYLVSTGGLPTTVGFAWGPADGGTQESAWATAGFVGPRGVGAYSNAIAGLTSGTRYFARAFATNAAGWGWAPQSAEFTTPGPSLAVGTNGFEVAATIGQPAVVSTLQVWNAGSGMMDFACTGDVPWLGVAPAFGFSTGNVVAVELSASPDGLDPGAHTGTVMVTAGEGVGGSPQFVTLRLEVAAASDTNAPTVPGGLHAIRVDETAYAVAWDASTDDVAVVGYEVEVNGTSAGMTAVTAFTNAGAEAGSAYVTRVRARDAAANWSAYGPPLAVTTLMARVASPEIDPAGGTYTGAVWVSMTCATTNATIRYTTDGGLPSAGAIEYAGAFALSNSALVQARAFRDGMEASDIVTQQFTIAASAVLSVSPASFFIPASTGYSPEPVDLDVWNSGAGAMAYSVSDGASWIEAVPGSGSSTGEHDAVSLFFTTTNLAMGSYTGTVTVTAPGAIGSPVDVPVLLSVTSGPPRVDNQTPTNVGSAAMSLRGYLFSTGGLPSTVRIYWGASDGGTSAAAWATNLNLGARGVGSFAATASNLAPWTVYYMRCMASNAAGVAWAPDSRSFSAGDWVLDVDPAELSAACEFGASPTTAVLRVRNAGSGSMAYSIGDNVTWLSQSPTSGSSTGEQDTITVSYAATALGAGSYTGTITVTSTGAVGSPRAVPVYLDVTNGPATLPSITNRPAASVMSGRAVLGGQVLSVGNSTTWVDVHWGTTDGGTNTEAWASRSNLGVRTVGVATGMVYGLSPFTQYYFRCSASNEAGVAWAPGSFTFLTSNQILSVSPQAFSNWIAPGEVCPSNAFQVRNAGSGSMSYMALDAVSWMSETPSSGTSTGESDNVWIVYSTTGLVSGVHTGRVTVSSPSGAAGDPQYVYSYLWVGVSPPSVTNQPPVGLSTNSAILQGYLTTTGGLPTTVGVAWGPADGGTTSEAWSAVGFVGTRGVGPYSNSIAGLASGSRYYARAFATNDAGWGWAPASVEFTTPGPALAVGTNEFDVAATIGQPAIVSTLQVWNAGSGEMDFACTGDVPWLGVAPAFGFSTGNVVAVEVNASPAGLDPGAYTGRVTVVAGEGVGGSPQQVEVRFAVSEGSAQMEVTPDSLAFGMVDVGSTGMMSFAVANTGGLSLTGTADVAGPFHIADGSPFLIEGGGTGAVTVGFAPAMAGGFTGAVFFACNGGAWTGSVSGAGGTPVTVPVVNNLTAANVTATSAELRGSLVSTGGATTHVFVCRGAVDGGEDPAAWSVVQSLGPRGTGMFGGNASNLVPGTAYFYRCMASNSAGIGWASGSTAFATASTNRVLIVSPPWLTRTARCDYTTPMTNFTVRNAGVGSMSYTIADDVTWAWTTLTSGSSTGETDTINLFFNTTNVAAGTYTGTVTVTAWGASNSPQTVTTVLTVTSSVPTVANQSPVSVSSNAATLRGYLSTPGGLPTTVCIFWGSSDGGTQPANWATNVSLGQRGMGGFSNAVVGLQDHTVYYYRCMASNTAGVAWAPATTNFFTASPVLAVSPATIEHRIVQGAGISNVSMQVWNADYGAMAYSVTDNVSWISVSPATGSSTGEQDTIVLSYAVTGLAIGAYTGLVTVTASGAADSPQYVTSYVTVTGGLPSVVNQGASGVVSNRATLGGSLTATGGSPTLVSVFWGETDAGSAEGAWQTGTNLGVRAPGTFSVDVEGLAAGRTYYFRCMASNFSGTAWAPASSSFVTPNLVLDVTPTAFTRYGARGSSLPADVFHVRNTGAGAMEWSATGGVSWMVVSPAGGTSTGESDSVTIQYSTAGLAAGAHTGTVTVTASGAAGAPQQVVSVLVLTNSTPGVENRPASNVTSVAAVLGGYLSSTGGLATSVGFGFGPADGGSDRGAWATNRHLGQRGQGSFSVSVGGLASNSTYFFRAWASNASGEVWAPASETFTTVNWILSCDAVSVTNRILQGTSLSNDSVRIWNSGSGSMAWTVADSASWLYESPPSGTSTGEQDTVTLSYSTATLAAGTHLAIVTAAAPGAVSSPRTFLRCVIVTNGTPVVTNQPATGVTSDTAGLRAYLVSTGGMATVAGFGCGPVDGGSQHWAWATNVNLGQCGQGSLALTLGGLASNTVYYYRAWASNAGGVAWAPSAASFTTLGLVLAADPDAFTNTVVQGAGFTNSIVVRNAGEGSMAYTVTDNAAWMFASPSSGSSTGEEDTVRAIGSTASLAPGTYTGAITVASSGATGSPRTIPSLLTVTPGLPWVENSSISPYAGSAWLYGRLVATGGLPTEVGFCLGQADGGTDAASWGATYGVGRRSPGTFSFCASNLVPGTLYYLRAWASNEAGVAWAPVSTNFTTRNWILASDPTSHTHSVAQGINPAGWTFQVWNAAVGSSGTGMAYYVSDNASWLSLAPTTGNSTGEQDTVVVTYAATTLAPGTYTGVVTVTASGALQSPQRIYDVLTVTGGVPVVLNHPASNVTATAGVLVGQLAANGGLPSAVTIHWGASDGGADANAWDAAIPLGTRSPGYFTAPVSNLTSEAVYYYRCRATNALGEAWASDTASFRTLNGVPGPRFVSHGGAHLYPYTNWFSAATNVQDAVDSANAGDTVWVTNGLYTVPSQVMIQKGVEVRSVNGAASTIVQPGVGSNRCFFAGHADAVVRGFTVRNGSVAYRAGDTRGGGVLLAGGATLLDCILVSNSAQYGGGVGLVRGGFVRNCVVTGNTATAYGGGADCYYGGRVENCVVISNRASSYGGGLSLLYGGEARNTLVARNYGAMGGGVWVLGTGAVVNCTVCDNAAGSSGGGLNGSGTNGVVLNSIVYFNTAPSGANVATNCSAWLRRSCTLPAAPVSGNVTNDPMPVSRTNANYRLQAGSVCVNAGSNLAWMAEAVDLDGAPRVRMDAVDMGAYEWAGAQPVIVNSAATAVDEASATVGGHLTSTGGSPVSVRIYWAASDGGTNEAAWSNRVEMGQRDIGPFSTNLQALASSQTYHFRSWASNAAGVVWAPAGSQFTTLDPGLDLSVSPLAFDRITGQGTSPTNDRVEVWNAGGGILTYAVSDDAPWLSATPAGGTSTGEHDVVTVMYAASALAAGSHTGRITVTAGGWTGMPRIVTVRLTVTNGAPVVSNQAPTSVTTSSAMLWGTMVSTGGIPTWAGIRWGMADGGTQPTAWSGLVNAGMRGVGTFGGSIAGLQPATRYYYRAVASNAAGLGWAQGSGTFVTPNWILAAAPSSMVAVAAQGVAPTSRTVEVWNSGTGSMAYTVSDNVSWLSVTPSGGSSTGEHDRLTVAYAVAGLQAGTYTGMIAIAAPGAGASPWYIAARLTVTNARPVITNISAIGLTSRSATLRGMLVSDGGSPVTAGICLGPADGGSDPSAWQSMFGLGTRSAGPLSVTADGLAPDTLYYYRCFAINGSGFAWAPASATLRTMNWILAADPATNLVGTLAGMNPTNASFIVWNAGSGTMVYSVSNETPWMTAGPAWGGSTGEADRIDLAFDASSLSVGSYTGIAIVEAAGAVDSPQYMVTILDVTNGAAMATNLAPTSITATSAVAQVGITTDGGLPTTAALFWGTTDGGTNANDWDASADLGTRTAGSYATDMTGLEDDTVYYYRVCTSNAAGVAWSPEASTFRTGPGSLSLSPGAVAGPLTGPLFGGPIMQTFDDPDGAFDIQVIQGRDAVDGVLDVVNSGRGTMYYTVESDVDWLQVDPAEGSSDGETDSVRLIYGTAALEIGSYTGTVTVTAPAAADSPQYYAVRLNVVAGPPVVENREPAGVDTTWAVLAGSLTATGGLPTAVQIYWGPVDGATNADAWAHAVDLGAASLGEFTAEVDGLEPGTTYYVRTSASNEAGLAWAPVSTNFNSSTPMLSLSTGLIGVAVSAGQNAPDYELGIRNSGEGAMAYGIESDSLWLSTDPTAGTSSGEVDPVAVRFATSELTVGVYTGVLTVTAPSADASPQMVTVVATVTQEMFSLTVESAHGGTSPGSMPVGSGTVVDQFVTNSPVAGGADTRFVCTGWSLTGPVPGSGSGTNASFAVTGNSVLTWQWTTNVRFEVSVNGEGHVTGDTPGWYTLGSHVAVEAHADTFHHFDRWSGDVPADDRTRNPLMLVMDGARSISAGFVPNLSLHGTPEWWLAAHGWSNDFAAVSAWDSDGDGSTNWQEWVALTDPTNAASVLRVEARGTADGAGVGLQWPAAAERTYTVQWSTNMAEGWNVLAAGVAGPEGALTDAVHGAMGWLCYRVDVDHDPAVHSVNIAGLARVFVPGSNGLALAAMPFAVADHRVANVAGTRGKPSSMAALADNIYYLDEESPTPRYISLYLRTLNGTNRWIDYSVTPNREATNRFLHPAVGFWYRNRASNNIAMELAGDAIVQPEFTNAIRGQSLQMLGWPYAARVGINQSGLTGGWASTTAGGADNVMFWDARKDPPGYVNLYLRNLNGTNVWINYSVMPNRLATNIFLEPGVGFWYTSRGSNDWNWIETRPYPR